MIEVLLLHREFPREVVVSSVVKALAMGAVNRASIELLARGAVAGEPVQMPLLEVGELDRYARALPDMAAYDELLGCGCGVGA
jgi:hypothetical protein